MDLLDATRGSQAGPPTAEQELHVVTRLLRQRFGDEFGVDMIERIARDELLLFERAKVRDFVPTIAFRLARDRLASGIGGSSTATPTTSCP